jgi:hypothetical protein
MGSGALIAVVGRGKELLKGRRRVAEWEGVCRRRYIQRTNRSTEIPAVMVSKFHGFGPGTF